MGDLEKKVKWGDVWREHGKPLEFYHERYPGLIRGQLTKEDRSLYQRLRHDDLLEKVPLKKPKPSRTSTFGDDPVAYYHKHFPGFTRGQLNKKDFSLYHRLWRDGLLDAVPFAEKSPKNNYDGNPVAYYQEHYDGFSRAELQKKDRSLYDCLRLVGLLSAVPTKVRDFGENPLDYYHQHYPCLTRGQLQKEDQCLYRRLRVDGLLGEVPLKNPHRSTERRDFGEDALAYYHEHYDGLSRGQLQEENESLYIRLRRDGLLVHVLVFLEPRDFGDDPLVYYREHYYGLTRGQLQKRDNTLYKRLRRDGLIEKVPLKYPTKNKPLLSP